MSHRSKVYPNVYDADNRQQIATVLQSMGFETDDISQAFNIFEQNYGDKKYDISVLTEIVFQVQNNEHPEADQNNNHQSHSAPNSAPNSPLPQPSQHIPQFASPQQPQKVYQPSAPQQQSVSTNDITSIFNSLQMNDANDNHRHNMLKPKAMSTSPQLQPHVHHKHHHQHRQQHQYKVRKDKVNMMDESKLDFVSCLQSFEKYANDENEIIEVLLQTIMNNNDFNNLVNWNDLFNNIKHRKTEWNGFKAKFNACDIIKNYDANKHQQIKQNLLNHKSKKKQQNKLKQKKNKQKDNETPKTPQFMNDSNEEEEEEKVDKVNTEKDSKNMSMLQKALQYEHDKKQYELLNKKDKLLVTANTYSILKNNKQKTELMISKCNEKMEEINRKIQELQNEKKQYFSALMRTKNKLLFQVQSIRETEISIKELHEETNKISTEIKSIQKTRNAVDKFEHQLSKITNVLQSNFNKQLEPTWTEWNNREVIIWINHIENERYQQNMKFLQSIQGSNLCGKDLPQMNDFVLRSFNMEIKTDRDLLLRNIQRITKLKRNVKRGRSKSDEKQLCVVCSDGEANHIMIPCGHIAVCSNCVQQVKQYKKCPFCGNNITNVIKCFHVGF